VSVIAKKSKKKKKRSIIPFLLVLLFIPASILTSNLAYKAWEELKELPFIEQFIHEKTDAEILMGNFDIPIPLEYIPIYKAAAQQYNIPWPLLAAHHRIETRFSTMKSDVSPVGAEGPMQFMPCTFVGWNHPSCKELGKGAISKSEKTNLDVIKKYGGYGVDGNGDGKADPFNMHDAIYSAANYLSKVGAKDGQLTKAVFNYNHSNEYVADVLYYYELYTSYEQELTALVE
jgi:peptidoglycan LD-endopeptidase LytH